MKKTYLVIAATAIIFGTTNCNDSGKKLDDATTEVSEASKDLIEANDAYLEEVKQFKLETAQKISENEKSIMEFNERIAGEKKEANKEYKEKIAQLEAKNSDLKLKIENYKADTKENWDKFKLEFSHDMDELGAAFKDLTTNNVK